MIIDLGQEGKVRWQLPLAGRLSGLPRCGQDLEALNTYGFRLATPHNPIVRYFYRLYSNHIMKPVGGLISHDRKAYDYLPDSIEEFPAPDEFMDLMRRVGFEECKRRSQSFGIAQIYIGQKP